eukprot:EG_transcript_17644
MRCEFWQGVPGIASLLRWGEETWVRRESFTKALAAKAASRRPPSSPGTDWIVARRGARGAGVPRSQPPNGRPPAGNSPPLAAVGRSGGRQMDGRGGDTLVSLGNLMGQTGVQENMEHMPPRMGKV